eukprot:7981029-Ditylum_brightwellii.AAC.1
MPSASKEGNIDITNGLKNGSKTSRSLLTHNSINKNNDYNKDTIGSSDKNQIGFDLLMLSYQMTLTLSAHLCLHQESLVQVVDASLVKIL